MDKQDIIRMAREAGLLHESDTAEIISECGVEVWLSPSDGVNMLERFAALAFAAGMNSERKKWKAYVAKWGTQNAVQDAVAAEREAILKLAETPIGEYEVVVACGTAPAPVRIPRFLEGQLLIQAIRARGQE